MPSQPSVRHAATKLPLPSLNLIIQSMPQIWRYGTPCSTRGWRGGAGEDRRRRLRGEAVPTAHGPLHGRQILHPPARLVLQMRLYVIHPRHACSSEDTSPAVERCTRRGTLLRNMALSLHLNKQAGGFNYVMCSAMNANESKERRPGGAHR